MKDRGAWCAIYSLWGFGVGHHLTNEQQQLWIEKECSGEPLVGRRAGRFLEGGASGLWDLSFSLLLCNSYVISKYTHTLFFVVRKGCQATEHVCTWVCLCAQVYVHYGLASVWRLLTRVYGGIFKKSWMPFWIYSHTKRYLVHTRISRTW